MPIRALVVCVLHHKDRGGYLPQTPYGLKSLKHLPPGQFQEMHVDFYFSSWAYDVTGEAVTLEANPGAPLGTHWYLNYRGHHCRRSKVIQLLSGRIGDKLMSLWFQVCKSNGYTLPFSREGLSSSDHYQARLASQVFVLEGQEECHPFWRICSLEPFVQHSSFAAHEASLGMVVKVK